MVQKSVREGFSLWFYQCCNTSGSQKGPGHALVLLTALEQGNMPPPPRAQLRTQRAATPSAPASPAVLGPREEGFFLLLSVAERKASLLTTSTAEYISSEDPLCSGVHEPQRLGGGALPSSRASLPTAATPDSHVALPRLPEHATSSGAGTCLRMRGGTSYARTGGSRAGGSGPARDGIGNRRRRGGSMPRPAAFPVRKEPPGRNAGGGSAHGGCGTGHQHSTVSQPIPCSRALPEGLQVCF